MKTKVKTKEKFKIARKGISPKAKRAVDLLLTKGGNKGDIMRKVGYSETVARTPSKVLETEAVIDYIDKRLNKGIISEWHGKLLKTGSFKKEYFDVDVPDDEIKQIIESAGGAVQSIKIVTLKSDENEQRKRVYWTRINHDAVARGVDMAWKLHGAYAENKDSTGEVLAGAFMNILRQMAENRNKLNEKR